MKVLGLNHGEINSACALLIDGKFVSAAAEERFTRQKRTKEFPKNAIDFCLNYGGIGLNDLDFVAQAWNPGAGWHKYQNLFNDQRVRREGYFYSLPDHLLQLGDARNSKRDWVLMRFPMSLPPIYFVQHHRAHAANGYFLSGFDEAAILTVDFRGEFESSSMCYGRDNEIAVLRTQDLPNSLGMFYATYTQLLGYMPDSDEWKVMALSAFDVDYEDFYDRIKRTVRLTEDGFFELDQSYYKGAIPDQPNLYTGKLVELLHGRTGTNEEQPTEWHFKVAKSMQRVSEEVAVHMLKSLYDRTKSRNLVVSGGFFMNSVLNGKIVDLTPFENLYVSHSPADVGNCFGAASYVYHCILNKPRTMHKSPSYLGPSYSESDVKSTLNRRKISYDYFDEWHEKVAELLSQGKVVAILHGRMEFGERALGNRSILGDPRSPEIKDKINALIKYRESYRPFAPASTFEEASDYFEVSDNYECPYMEKVIQLKHEFIEKLPGIVHVDGSARLQVVKNDDNHNFHKIIRKFGDLTGFHVVLNTSFNINGEPIVCSPDDALTTFFNSGLEHLFIEGFYVTK